jgi:5'-methylthioadenosine phosphorylase
MTTAPETILANELCIPVAVVALCTDFDSWRTDINPPSTQEIREIIDQNVDNLIELIRITLEKV